MAIPEVVELVALLVVIEKIKYLRYDSRKYKLVKSKNNYEEFRNLGYKRRLRENTPKPL